MTSIADECARDDHLNSSCLRSLNLPRTGVLIWLAHHMLLEAKRLSLLPGTPVVIAATLTGALLASLAAAWIGRDAALNLGIVVIAAAAVPATRLPTRVAAERSAKPQVSEPAKSRCRRRMNAVSRASPTQRQQTVR